MLPFHLFYTSKIKDLSYCYWVRTDNVCEIILITNCFFRMLPEEEAAGTFEDVDRNDDPLVTWIHMELTVLHLVLMQEKTIIMWLNTF